MIGCLKKMFENGLDNKNIIEYYGTSAGAILSLLLSIGYD